MTRLTDHMAAWTYGPLTRAWGLATEELGIQSVHHTKREALRKAPFCTPINRRRVGKLYIYWSQGGTEVVIGKVFDLRAAGFQYADGPSLA